MSDQYAVFGNPIGHSKSPQIHASFAKSTLQDVIYTAQLVEIDQFDSAARRFFADGGMGFNITVPFKEDAYRFADELSPQAKLAGAVNTLVHKDSVIIGHNTDGVGLVTDLEVNCGVSLSGLNVLVLGAGGAVRGCLQPILERKPNSLTIANRTLSKAQELAQLFSAENPDIDITALEYHELITCYDLIINGTSASLNSEIPPLPDCLVGSETICYDMMYGADLTAFNRWADSKGAKEVFDGLGMLVCQAAQAFHIWRGVLPATQEVIADLRSTL